MVLPMGVLPDLGDPTDPAVRTRYAYLQASVSIGVNLSLFAGKLVLASVMASVAVLTDAFNGLGDVAVSAMILVVFRFSGLEADPAHPYGHGRLEHIAAVVVAAFLIFVGVVLLLQSALELSNPVVRGTLPLALILTGLAATKELLARFSFAVARRIDSEALRGDAWNHRYDALLTGAIALAIYLTTFSPGLRVLDPVFGVLVAGFIVVTGGRLMRDAGERLLGSAPSPELLRRIEKLATTCEGCRDVRGIRVHEYGPQKAISLTVEVDEDLSVREGHEIARRVAKAIEGELQASATVQVEPGRARGS